MLSKAENMFYTKSNLIIFFGSFIISKISLTSFNISIKTDWQIINIFAAFKDFVHQAGNMGV